MRKHLLTLLLALTPLLALGQKEIKLEVLSPHNVAGTQGVSAPFAGWVNGHLLVAGGANFPDVPAADGGQKEMYSQVWQLSQSGWFESQKLKLPRPTAYGAYVTVPEGIVCIGGTDGKQSLRDAYVINYDTLRQLPPLPVGIDNGSAASYNGYIYVAGGQTDGKPQHTVYRLAYPAGKQWEAIAQMPGQGRLQPAAVVQSDGAEMALYVFGGYDPDTARIAMSVLKMNLKTKAWSRQPHGKATVGMTAVNSGYSHVLFFGGVDRQIFESALRGEQDSLYLRHAPAWYKFNPDIWVYHTITNTWYSIPGRTFFARAGAGLAKADDGSIILVDGENRPGVRSSEVVKVKFESEVSFGWLNWAVLAFYLIAMLGMGVYFMRREGGSDDFFRGGGRVPWWAAGISIYATMLSAITYMSIPAKAYATNWTYYPMLITILLVSYPVVKYYIPYFRKLNITSAYEYLEQRFNLATRMMASSLFIIFMIARMALVLYLPSLALTAVTGIDINICILLMGTITIIYCTMGGVEAVIWGDVVQGIILIGGAFLAAGYLIFNTMGGPEHAWEIAVNEDKMRMFEWSMDYRSMTFWVAILGGLANNLISYTSDQTVIQRYLTTPDVEGAKKSVWVNGLMSVFISVVFYIIGTGLYTFYQTHPQELDIQMAKGDAIFPFFMMSQMPQGIAGLLIAAIFAATMSTISSNINSVSTAFSIDFWKRFRAKTNDKEMLSVARLSCVISGIIGVALALLMAQWDILSLLDYFNTILGLLTSGLGGLFIMGLFLPRISGYQALFGFVVATIVVFWLQFYTDTSVFLFGAVGIAVSVLVGWLLSLFAPRKN